jgi:pilus assembly protein Flp/PilA
MKLFAQFLCDQSGATAIEYALFAAGISVAIIAVVNAPRFAVADDHQLTAAGK